MFQRIYTKLTVLYSYLYTLHKPVASKPTRNDRVHYLMKCAFADCVTFWRHSYTRLTTRLNAQKSKTIILQYGIIAKICTTVTRSGTAVPISWWMLLTQLLRKLNISPFPETFDALQSSLRIYDQETICVEGKSFGGGLGCLEPAKSRTAQEVPRSTRFYSPVVTSVVPRTFLSRTRRSN